MVAYEPPFTSPSSNPFFEKMAEHLVLKNVKAATEFFEHNLSKIKLWSRFHMNGIAARARRLAKEANLSNHETILRLYRSDQDREVSQYPAARRQVGSMN